jgi:hypothetical protein
MYTKHNKVTRKGKKKHDESESERERESDDYYDGNMYKKTTSKNREAPPLSCYILDPIVRKIVA